MIEFLNGLLEKFSKAAPQIDFGNFLVGVGTVFLAVVSLYVAHRRDKADSRAKIAQFRQQWIDDLRNKLVEHSEKIRILMYELAYSEEERRTTESRINVIYSEIFGIEAYIRLKLNPAEASHVRLADNLVKQRRHVNSLSRKVIDREFNEKLQELRQEFINVSKSILKEEWERVKDEAHGRTRLSSYIRRIPKKIGTTRNTAMWTAIPDDTYPPKPKD